MTKETTVPQNKAICHINYLQILLITWSNFIRHVANRNVVLSSLCTKHLACEILCSF